MKALHIITTAIDRFTERLGRVVSWLCLLMVLVGGFNAVTRYFGRATNVNLSSNALIEVQWYMFAVLFLLGASWTLRRDAHVRVDVFYGRLSQRGQHIIDIAGIVIFLIPFCVFGIWASWDYVFNSISQLETSADPGGLPRYPIKAMIPLAFGLLLLQGLSELIKHIRDVSNLGSHPDPAAVLGDEWSEL